MLILLLAVAAIGLAVLAALFDRKQVEALALAIILLALIHILPAV